YLLRYHPNGKGKQFGYADIENRVPITASTRFRLASVSKTFIAAAILKIMESGDLLLNDPIYRFFPSFPNATVITPYHLLSHTSGLRDWYETSVSTERPQDWVVGPRTHEVLMTMADPFRFEPGTDHWYSNSGYLLLGDIIEAVTGVSWQEFLTNDLLPQAGIDAIEIETTEAQANTWAIGYHKHADELGTYLRSDFSGLPGAAGSLRATSAALADWSKALFVDHSVLKPETLKKMTEMATLKDGRLVSDSTYFPPEWGERPPQSPLMQQSGWGLGFSLFHTNGSPVVWHSGGIPGFNAIWLNFPDELLSIGLLSNTDNGVVNLFENTVQRVVVTKH
ncbi:MAG: serine hydrolase domain-containing protein, partial [Pseudomonadota bacterium]